MADTRDKLRGLVLSALVVVSVFSGSIALSGTVAAAANAGPETVDDVGVDAGTIGAGNTATVQVFDVGDSDEDDQPVTVDSVTVDGMEGTEITGADLARIEIVDTDSDTVVGSTESPTFGGSVPLDESGGFQVSDDGVGSLGVRVTIAEDAATAGDLAIESTLDWSEGDNDGQSRVQDGVTEQVDAIAPDVGTDVTDAVVGGDLDVTSLFSGVGDYDTSYDYDAGEGYSSIGTPSAFDTTALDDGDVTVRATATDDHGNEATAEATVTVDNTDPAGLTIESPTDPTTVQSGDSVQVEWDMAETNLDTVTVRLRQSGETVATFEDTDVRPGGSTNIALDAPDTGEVQAGQTYDLQLAATDAAGNTATTPVSEGTPTITVDDGDGLGAAIDAPGDGDVLTSLGTISGSAADDSGPAQVTLEIERTSDGFTWDNSQDAFTDSETTVSLGETDSWDYAGASSVTAEGEYTITATASDDAGNEVTDAHAVTIDTSDPNVGITSPADNALAGSQDEISGTASDDTELETVALDVSNGTHTWNGEAFTAEATTVEATLDGEGDAWSYDSSAIDATGTYDVTATATDAAGNTATDSVTYDVDATGPAAVTVETPSDGAAVPVSSDGQFEVEWSYDEPNPASVSVTLENGDDAVTYETDDSEYGEGPSSALLDLGAEPTDSSGEGIVSGATYDVTVTATDEFGNAGGTDTATDAVTIDDDSLSVEIDSPDDGAVEQPLSSISGTATDDNAVSTVELTLQNDEDEYWDGETWNAEPQSLSPSADDNGNFGDATEDWTYVSSLPGSAGTYTVTATATDAAGNTATDSVTYEIDDQVPSSLTVSLAGETATVYEQPDGQVAVTYGYQEANPGSTALRLVQANGDDTATYVIDENDADPNGNPTLDLTDPDETTGDGIADGQEYDVELVATDEAGNEATLQAEGDALVVDGDSLSVGIDSPTDGAVEQSVTEVSGTATDDNAVTGVELTLQNDEDQYWDGEGWQEERYTESATAEGGSWTTGASTLPSADSTYTLTATATDAAGNEDTAAASYTIDTSDPTGVSLDAPTEMVHAPADGTLDLAWSYEDDNPGTVEVTLDDGSSEYTYTVDDSDYAGDGTEGGTTLDLAADENSLTDGTYAVSITPVDAAGNEGPSDASDGDVLTVDSEGPTGPGVDEPTGTVHVSDPTTETLNVSYAYTEAYPDVAEIRLVDGESGYTWTVEDDDYVEDDTTKSVTVALDAFDQPVEGETLRDGTFGVEVVATDAAGNEQSFTNGGSVHVDTTAPTFDNATFENSSQTGPFTVDVTDEPGLGATDADPSGVDPASIAVTVDSSGETLLENATVDANDGLTFGDGTLTVDAAAAGVEYAEDGSVTFTVSAADDHGHETTETFEYTVRSGGPAIESVEAEAGADQVTLTFSEGVTDGEDNAIAATDLAYEDGSGDGAAEVTAVDHAAGDATATLTLDAPVSPAGIDTDRVSARADAIHDADDEGTVAETPGVALTDTTAPVEPGINAVPINASNENSYDVTLTYPDGAEGSVASVAVNHSDTIHGLGEAPVDNGETTVTVEDIEIDEAAPEGELTVEVAAVDLQYANAEDLEDPDTLPDHAWTWTNTTVEKDTVSPTVEAATVDAGSDTISVTTSEPVTVEGTDDPFTVDSDLPPVESVDWAESEEPVSEFEVTLSDSLTYDEFTSGSVEPVEASLEDAVGNDASLESSGFTDATAPSISLVDATVGTDQVVVHFSEPVTSASDSGLTAANVTYTDVHAGNATTIESVDHNEGDAAATLTVDAPVAVADLRNDTVATDGVYDAGDTAVDEEMSLDTLALTTEPAMVAENGTVTAGLYATERLESASLDYEWTGPGDHDRTVTSFNVTAVNTSDWDVTFPDGYFGANGTIFAYVDEFDAPADGRYELASLSMTDTSGDTRVIDDSIIEMPTAETDTADPTVSDAVLSDYDGEVTTLTVEFTEFVDPAGEGEGAIDPADVSIAGIDDNRVLDVQRTSGTDYEVAVGGQVQTGTSPNVTLAAGSYQETFGDGTTGGESSTTVHTVERHLTAGPNFLSVPAKTGGVDAATVVDQLGADNVESIMTYQGENWQSYNPDKPDGEQDFETLAGGQGYVVTLTASASLSLNVNNVAAGTPENPTPGVVELHEGWNLVGHWQAGDQQPDRALQTISDDWASLVYTLSSDRSGFAYERLGDGDFEPGQAYWVFVTEDTSYAVSGTTADEPDGPPVVG